MSNGPQNIEVRYPETLQAGTYANSMMVSHTKEEFIIDFMVIAQPVSSVTARVIVSPGHMKRMIAALQENLANYEKAFGSIEKAEEPTSKFGFQP